MLKIIGISGFARVGKDTLAEAINQSVDSCRKFAFAYELKVSLNNLLKNNFGISAFTENEEEKKIIRPILVSYGNAAREINPNFWVNKVEAKISSMKYNHQSENYQEKKLAVITDCRFTNEVEWIKAQGGKIVWLERLGFGAANEEEEEYTHPIKNLADHQLSWPTLGSNATEKAREYVKELLSHL